MKIESDENSHHKKLLNVKKTKETWAANILEVEKSLATTRKKFLPFIEVEMRKT